eukprot:8071861-Alexandrium_andersonii.AAC.1
MGELQFAQLASAFGRGAPPKSPRSDRRPPRVQVLARAKWPGAPHAEGVQGVAASDARARG